MAGFFVSGTDTGVGKTFVACALARGLRAAGLDLGVMKPAETGVPDAGPEDARALIAAAGVDDPLELVCPVQLDLPAAPLVAAREQGLKVDLAAIDAAWAELTRRHEHMLVEGAGGLLVPLDEQLDMAGLAARLGLPILLVARAALGTINHTLLSIEACDRRGLDLIGVVVSHAEGTLTGADARNLALLRERLGSRLIGELPPQEPGDLPKAADAGLAAVRARLA